MTKHVYQQETDRLMKDLNTSPEGLSQTEAQQRLQENGPNRVEGKAN
ncbi:cation-transporting P-type ATPase [Enterococcus avium]